MGEQVEPGQPGWPLGAPRPAAFSAAQVESVLTEVRARREQVRALTEQLAAFDSQLEAFEKTLQPVLEWSAAWAQLERTMLGPWSGPPAGEQR